MPIVATYGHVPRLFPFDTAHTVASSELGNKSIGEQVEPVDDTSLRTLLLERIKEKGSITFAEFMAACLYEPGLGYYTSSGRKVGAEGDFYTSSNVHRVFGRLIAREIIRMWQSMDRPSDFQIVEAGAGN